MTCQLQSMQVEDKFPYVATTSTPGILRLEIGMESRSIFMSTPVFRMLFRRNRTNPYNLAHSATLQAEAFLRNIVHTLSANAHNAFTHNFTPAPQMMRTICKVYNIKHIENSLALCTPHFFTSFTSPRTLDTHLGSDGTPFAEHMNVPSFCIIRDPNKAQAQFDVILSSMRCKKECDRMIIMFPTNSTISAKLDVTQLEQSLFGIPHARTIAMLPQNSYVFFKDPFISRSYHTMHNAWYPNRLAWAIVALTREQPDDAQFIPHTRNLIQQQVEDASTLIGPLMRPSHTTMTNYRPISMSKDTKLPMYNDRPQPRPIVTQTMDIFALLAARNLVTLGTAPYLPLVHCHSDTDCFDDPHTRFTWTRPELE